MEEKKPSQFMRDDGFNPSVKYDDPVQETWIHKDVVKFTGDTEDDFIIEQKAVCINKVNVYKQIQAEAKTTDLKYLLKQLLATGDESILNQRQGFYGDITAFGDGKELHRAEQLDLQAIRDKLPDEFKTLTNEQLASLSNDEIIAYFEGLRKLAAEGAAGKVKEEKKNLPEGDK